MTLYGSCRTKTAFEVAVKYTKIDVVGIAPGLKLSASFMALLVNPYLKLCDKGLLDVDGFRLIGG